MNLLFVKINFIIFEIVSLVLTFIVLFGLMYYTMLFKRKSAMKQENQKIIQVSYEINITSNLYTDVDFKIKEYGGEKDNGYIIYDKTYYANMTKKEIIEKINSTDPNNIFIFNSKRAANTFLIGLKNLSASSNDFFNTAILFVVNLFFIFMKITLIRISIKQIKEIKSNKKDPNKVDDIFSQLSTSPSMDHILPPDETNSLGDSLIQHSININKEKPIQKQVTYNPVLTLLNPKNFFNFCIFHISTIVIIPILYPNLTDYDFGGYFGFRKNLFHSVYFGRTNIGQKSFYSFSEIEYKPEPFNNNYFILHRPMSIVSFYIPKFNPYLVNLGFLVCAVWVAQSFKPFDQTQITFSERIKVSKFKKVMNYVIPCIIFSIWGAFLVWGLFNIGEFLYLFHFEVFHSIRKLFDIKISFIIGCFYFHVYFYILMAFYTLQVKYKNRKANKK